MTLFQTLSALKYLKENLQIIHRGEFLAFEPRVGSGAL